MAVDKPIALGRTDGRGPLLVYLHGLGCAGSRDWPPVAEAPALRGRASLWVDLPGFGRSPRPEGFGYDLAEQAELLAGLLLSGRPGGGSDGASGPDGGAPSGSPVASGPNRGAPSGSAGAPGPGDDPGRAPDPVHAPGLAEPLVLIGHSMGGTLAVMLAEKLLERGAPLKAVLVAEPNLRPADASMSAQVAAKSQERFLKAWPRWVAAFPSEHYRRDMELADPLAFYRSAVSLVRHGAAMLERLVRLPVPKGYILGARSEPFTHETAQLVAAAGVDVVTVERSGHGFSEDDPAGFAQAIADLLARFGL